MLTSAGGTTIPKRPDADPSVAIEAIRYAGTYETHMSRIVVNEVAGELRATISQRNNESLGTLPDHHLVLRPIGTDRFLAEDRPYGATSVVGFTAFDDDTKGRFLFSGFRLAERVR